MDIHTLITKFNAMVFFVPDRKIPGKNAITKKVLAGYYIFVRESLSPKKLAQVIEHELWHIILGHLDEHKDLSNEQKELEVFVNMQTAVSPYRQTDGNGLNKSPKALMIIPL